MTYESEQIKLLRQHLEYLAGHSSYYRSVLANSGEDSSAITTLSDLQRLPFTTKEDLQEHHEDFICVKRRQLIDHITTSGTTGKPLTLSLTEKDLQRLAENECNSFKIAGISADDTIQLMTTIDRRFMAGLAYFLGARKLGAGIIRVGNGIPRLQWDTISEMRPTVLICVPTFLLKLIQFAEDSNIDFKNSSVRKAVCIGESIYNNDFSLNTLGRKITEKWPLELFSTYASSEMATAFTECEKHHGLHSQPELMIAEVLDDAGKPVADGQTGELVVTPLGVEGMPLLRFRTGDICAAHYSPCECGRPGLRIGPILGRKGQRIKYRGTSFYPGMLYDLLQNIPQVKNFQIEVHSGELGTDEVLIHIGLSSGENLTFTEITDIFKAKLRVVPRFSFMTAEELDRRLFVNDARKPLVFIDKRLSTD